MTTTKKLFTSYCLISTTNSSVNGWECFGFSFSKEELKKKADELWAGSQDVYDETYLRNYKIVNETTARKTYKAFVNCGGEYFRV